MTLLTIGLFLATFWAPTPGAAGTNDYQVGAPGAALADAGYDVLHDYGTFATARLTDQDVASLGAQGVSLSLLPREIGRGLLRVDPAEEGKGVALATGYHLVQFDGPVKRDWQIALQRESAAVYDYLPHFTYLVRTIGQDVEALRDIPGVRAVMPYVPEFKVSASLPTEGVVEATALAYLDSDIHAAIDGITRAGGHVTGYATAQLEHVIDFTILAQNLDAVAAIETVSWIEPAYDDGSTDNALSSGITQSADPNVYSIHDKGVDGRTQIASVCDTGVNTSPVQGANYIETLTGMSIVTMTHEMFHDAEGTGLVQYNHHLAATNIQDVLPHRKVALYYSAQEGGNRGDSDDTSGHGTHTGGTIAGDKPPYGQRDGHDGVAFAAGLAVCDVTRGGSFQIINDYANYWNPAYDLGSRINSNSWGAGHTRDYTEKARQHDAYIWENRDFNVLRSAGNAPSTLRISAAAKSAMGIGATDNGAGGMEQIASFSSTGPTTDGRIKPNVVAPGNCLTSSYISGAQSYACLGGTSMSTPTVAGAATLVRDYFERGFYPSGEENEADALNPSSALVRGVLQISGREIAGDRGVSAFPNGVQGWGRVTLDDVLYFDGDARKTLLVDEDTELGTGQSESTAVTVNAGDSLRVMVTWSDQAGAAGANPAIVNDLDLTVTGPGGTYIGNAFVGSETPPNQGTPDRRNVEEAVYITAPAAGTYTVTVTGANVPDGPQPYALVVTGNLA